MAVSLAVTEQGHLRIRDRGADPARPPGDGWPCARAKFRRANLSALSCQEAPEPTVEATRPDRSPTTPPPEHPTRPPAAGPYRWPACLEARDPEEDGVPAYQVTWTLLTPSLPRAKRSPSRRRPGRRVRDRSRPASSAGVRSTGRAAGSALVSARQTSPLPARSVRAEPTDPQAEDHSSARARYVTEIPRVQVVLPVQPGFAAELVEAVGRPGTPAAHRRDERAVGSGNSKWCSRSKGVTTASGTGGASTHRCLRALKSGYSGSAWAITRIRSRTASASHTACTLPPSIRGPSAPPEFGGGRAVPVSGSGQSCLSYLRSVSSPVRQLSSAAAGRVLEEAREGPGDRLRTLGKGGIVIEKVVS